MKVTINFWDKGGASAGKSIVKKGDNIDPEQILKDCVVPHYTYTITMVVNDWPVEEYTSDKRYIGLLGL